jgi:hypothetical protein
MRICLTLPAWHPIHTNDLQYFGESAFVLSSMPALWLAAADDS